MSSPTIAAAAPVPLLDRWRFGARALVADFRLDAGLITIFVASRIIVVGAALVAEYFIPRNPALSPGADGPILRSLTTWDGWWYLGIVANGYHADPVVGAYSNVAFPPLYPAILKVLSLPIPGYAGILGVLVSNVAFLLALGLFVRLGTPYIGRRRASLAAGLLVIYPFASVFAMAYSESLFLLLMFATFLAAERRHRAWAGIFLARGFRWSPRGPSILRFIGQKEFQRHAHARHRQEQHGHRKTLIHRGEAGRISKAIPQHLA